MEIWHIISFNQKDGVDNLLDSLKIEYKKNVLPRGYTIHFDIAESDLRWPQISAILQEYHGFDWSNSVFSNTEILETEWVRLMPNFEYGYPQPKNFRKFIQNTYEIKCPRCGAGNFQIAPICLLKEPGLGTPEFISVFWTYSLFCKHKVLEDLNTHNIQGYATLPIIIQSTGESSKFITQITFPAIAQPALADEDKINPETCGICGTPKYAYIKKGYMHLRRDALVKGVDCQLTFEWFGGARFREILISHRFAEIIINNNWQGVSLKPIKLI